ncbi:CPXCG motif-containing cysteine-rich protein [Hydrogenimonas thermophila]|uniref:Cysteine-rich CPXCG n=1 Tax=Hydrogenimonas thermophila TaxID=223786 RepID=A0A1I5M0X4_9BACT|nr:CPXCG motif-containing cysteine-rich protein [Hydrogenimonas thermophila]WOE70542.1 CPXCG motif-containing cysteine-rich protein [Hydrogenimonas thermophila]WOE73058.1 CPXCG motif-containing cysteine-rich protein [Hydrogenimonas thermophila]SFP03219.1 Cysteine-rich CPXCG [Hydrogenimonas thermophila]
MIEYFFSCPYCWQRVSILIDSGLTRFEGIEDCEVCCNPISFIVELESGQIVSSYVEKVQ